MFAIFATVELFDHAYRSGNRAALWARLSGHSNRLIRLATDHQRHTGARRFAGRQSVPIARISGSEGRDLDFDRQFRPRRKSMRSRWQAIAGEMLRGVDLPPVELIQIGERYYVRDGHHRISVAAALGWREVDALVTVWQPSAMGASDRREEGSIPVAAQSLRAGDTGEPQTATWSPRGIPAPTHGAEPCGG
jgi:hypothetical protein